MEKNVEEKNELILDWVKKHNLKEDEFYYILGWFQRMSIGSHFVDTMYKIITNDKYRFCDNEENFKEVYDSSKDIAFELDNKFLILRSEGF